MLREVIFRVFETLATGRAVAADELGTLNEALVTALGRACLVAVEPTGFGWGWAWDDGTNPAGLEAPLWPVARSAADLLTSGQLGALCICAAERCDWLFLDASRNGSRRWCSMRTCGNRAKNRRHHARIRAAGRQR